MKYKSTRGLRSPSGFSFEECISRGYAPDGGLFVPDALPQVEQATLEAWRKLDFPSLAEEIFKLFLGAELEAAELKAVIRGCYSGFHSKEIVPVKRVGGLYVSELFHGPTFCFKDLGQQPLVRLIALFAEKRQERRTMLVSTTGDTGPAAMQAASDANSQNLEIIVFYPEGQISDLQRKQMTTMTGPRARVAAFKGGGDDMDIPLKRLAGDAALLKKIGLCGINSYNLGRPVAQLVHYFWTYFRVVDQQGLQIGDRVDIVLPTGAMGNIAAGFMSKRMGLPLGKLVAGVNTNDITHRTFAAGTFHRSEQMEKTLSDAINIQVPYNMERLFYYMTGEDSKLVSTWMAEMDRSGKLTLPAEWLTKLQQEFDSRRVDDAAMCAAMKHCKDTYGYLADPHTAVALAAAWGVYGEGAPSSSGPAAVAVLATASPCKFEHSVTVAVGEANWKAYLNGAEFPDAARKILAAQEKPYPTLQQVNGNLAESQLAWEAEVRRMLAASSQPTAKL
eukprot:TRINITY_DN123547_c0_g1_i1.p1 TRINITY_DN123547_c0_g1~~TRINITY_DN123547_c0_g1_i1.p1  ORF type:complete len:504 (+),score=132.67 TRINITY_DN123547_c0_g1_i1:149-1660(+)